MAINQAQVALPALKKIGNYINQYWLLSLTGNRLLHLGDIDEALSYCLSAVEIVQAHGIQDYFVPRLYNILGCVYLSRMEIDKAIQTFREAFNASADRNLFKWMNHFNLGWAFFAKEEHVNALDSFRSALTSWHGEGSFEGLFFPALLSGIERVSPDFYSHECYGKKKEQLDWWIVKNKMVQTYLALVVKEFQVDDNHVLDFSQPGTWHWEDQFDDCSYQLDDELIIQATNDRDLFFLNLSAPRFTHLMKGDFGIQVLSEPAFSDRPAIGGLLIWKDKGNYLCLERGRWGTDEINFRGCVENQDLNFGRGRLPLGPSDEVYLRLERQENQVNAYCSTNGEDWFTVGYATFPVDVPLEIGMHAIGTIHRFIYLGAYPEGTAIKFLNFWMWAK
jgi:tetratricopeptide (TPR) repeat protein